MKTGIIFAGQGAQYPGIGRSLYDNYPEARAVFDAAGAEIKGWCFEGSKELLRQTHVTQPAVYAMTMAAWAAFKGGFDKLAKDDGDGLEIAAMAGFSLGEYAALAAAGCMEAFPAGLSIVRKRGVFMAEAGTDAEGNPKGGMAAVFGEREKILNCIEMIREGSVLEAVNFNSPEQTVAAGDLEAVDRLKKQAREFGLKALTLKVSAAFHSSMMIPAADRMERELADLSFRAPGIPVYSNVTGKELRANQGKEISDSEWIKSRMVLQLKSPVYWQETIENMHEDGVELFVEIGPGRTLSGLVKKIVPDAETAHVEDAESLENALKVIRTKRSANR
ncbi:MAG: ACP S-malonyltransferase [Clostridiales Family XIII bacterium]|jgi:[acyl-carrier-protein] S-malonyltransferase|nr:ACP S-malonyltransferase [Clostridiales Family XIII bacterium]